MRKWIEYKLTFEKKQVIEMPAKANIVPVREKDGAICFWIMADPCNPMMKKEVFVFKTGMSVSDKMLEGTSYLGTCVIGGDAWHVLLRSEPGYYKGSSFEKRDIPPSSVWRNK